MTVADLFLYERSFYWTEFLKTEILLKRISEDRDNELISTTEAVVKMCSLK